MSYSFGGTPKARQPLMLLCLLSLSPSRSHVHTSGTKPAICLYLVSCNFLNGQPEKYFPADSPKNFLEENKERGNGP